MKLQTAFIIQRNSPRYRILMLAGLIFPRTVAPLYRTPVEHFQPFVLFTNYTRYVDEFVRWGCSQILDPDSPYIALSCAGGNWITAETEAPEEAISDLAWKKHQMPAWHLITADGRGITLVNIGVGPSMLKPSAIIWQCYARMSG